MHIVVEFWSQEGLGVECNGVQFAIRGFDQQNCGKCIVRGVSSTVIWVSWIQWVRTGTVVKAF